MMIEQPVWTELPLFQINLFQINWTQTKIESIIFKHLSLSKAQAHKRFVEVRRTNDSVSGAYGASSLLFCCLEKRKVRRKQFVLSAEKNQITKGMYQHPRKHGVAKCDFAPRPTTNKQNHRRSLNAKVSSGLPSFSVYQRKRLPKGRLPKPFTKDLPKIIYQIVQWFTKIPKFTKPA